MKKPMQTKNMVRSRTAERLKKLAREVRHVARKPDDADGIHDLRVSIRRLRQELRVFKAWFDADEAKRVRRRLRKLMDRCAAVRNCDVGMEVLKAAGCDKAKLVAALKKERQRTRKDLVQTLEDWRKKDRVGEWRGHLPSARSASKETTKESAQEIAERLLPAMLDDLFRSGRTAVLPASDHRRMHQLRLKAKRLRYTLELFEPLYGAKIAEITETLKGLQMKLGAINDCATTLEMIRRDRAAAAAVRLLVTEREVGFRAYWKAHFAPKNRTPWKAALQAADRIE